MPRSYTSYTPYNADRSSSPAVRSPARLASRADNRPARRSGSPASAYNASARNSASSGQRHNASARSRSASSPAHNSPHPLRTFLKFFCLGALVAVATFAILRIINRPSPTETSVPDTADDTKTTNDSDDNTDGDSKETPSFISLQPTVDSWLKTITGKAGVYIYDLDNDRLAASYEPDQTFLTASLYKLFVAYEGYREIEQGTKKASQKNYSGSHTRAECLDLMIRESDSPCGETMWAEIGHEKLDRIIKTDFKITHSNISGLASTPADIAAMLKIYYEHKDLSESTWETIQDSMLNQPVTTYDWRRGLPAGFTTAKVYNKVGWDHSTTDETWNLYHDAAIITFDKTSAAPARHYVAVIMTSKVPYQSLTALGSALEQTILDN